MVESSPNMCKSLDVIPDTIKNEKENIQSKKRIYSGKQVDISSVSRPPLCPLLFREDPMLLCLRREAKESVLIRVCLHLHGRAGVCVWYQNVPANL